LKTQNYVKCLEVFRLNGILKRSELKNSKMPTAGKKLVIAIDVGWKTSGFAYSLVSSPEAITCSTFGAGNSRTPTAVLLDTGMVALVGV